jgi:hypothetical protein
MTRVAPRRLWQVAVGLAFLNLLTLVLLVLPARDARTAQEARLLDLQRRIRTVQQAGQAGDDLGAARREAEAFVQGFPPRDGVLELKGRLTQLARTLALEIPTVDYRPTDVKEAGLIKLTMVLTVQGSYPKIRRYLYELEGLRRSLVIERVALRDAGGRTADLLVQLQLALYLRAG